MDKFEHASKRSQQCLKVTLKLSHQYLEAESSISRQGLKARLEFSNLNLIAKSELSEKYFRSVQCCETTTRNDACGDLRIDDHSTGLYHRKGSSGASTVLDSMTGMTRVETLDPLVISFDLHEQGATRHLCLLSSMTMMGTCGNVLLVGIIYMD